MQICCREEPYEEIEERMNSVENSIYLILGLLIFLSTLKVASVLQAIYKKHNDMILEKNYMNTEVERGQVQNQSERS